MKNFCIILLFLFIDAVVLAQTTECAFNPTQAQIDAIDFIYQDAPYFDLADIAADPIDYIPITAIIVRQTDGTGGLSTTDLNNAITRLNTLYSSMHIQFFLCSTKYVNNSTYYNFNNSQENALASGNEVSNTINIFFVNTAVAGSTPVCGYAYFPGAYDRIIMANACATNGSTLAHEMGHYFGLLHTFHLYNENVPRTGTCSNCTTAGDRLCDTPADRGVGFTAYPTCSYTGTAVDNCSIALATNPPSPRNLMSYGDKPCRDMFTPQQQGVIISTNNAYRSYLACSTPCNTPTNLTASPTTNTATLSWSAVSGAVSYNVQYKPNGATTWTTVSATTSTLSLTGLSSATTYQFQVQTVCGGGASVYSTIANFTTNSTCYALSFNGSQRVTIPNNTTITPNPMALGTGDFTVTAWIKASNVTGKRAIISKRSTTSNGFIVGIDENGKLFARVGATDLPAVTNSPNLKDGTCHHVALARRSNMYWFVIDGTSYLGNYPTTGANADVSTTSALIIGQDAVIGSGINGFVGTIDEVQIWKRVLNATEIQNNSMNGVEFANRAYLTAYWKFDETSGQTISDLTGKGNNGYLGTSTSVTTTDPTRTNTATDICRCPAPAATLNCNQLSLGTINDFIKINNPFATITGDWTIEMWLKIPAGTPNGSVIFTNQNSATSANTGKGLNFYLSNGNIKVFNPKEYSFGTSSGTLATDQCMHFYVTYNSVTKSLNHANDYGNIGATSTSGGWTMNVDINSGNPLYIGGYGTGPAFTDINGVAQQSMVGFVDEIRIWNKKSADISAQLGKPQLIGTETGLIGNWRLNEGSGQNLTNSKTGTVDAYLGNSSSAETANDPIWSTNTSCVCNVNPSTGKYTNILDNTVAAENGIKLYPNPATDWINVEYTATSDNATDIEVQVVDLTGKIVYSTTMPITDQTTYFSLPTNNLVAGMYLVEIKSATARHIQRIVIQR
ncbi:MAG: fibronectin type III domain-containing protein [Chitinophagales bacterium]|nr:fibronectin type III domain-containing protein [Chitinophagales bacterium]